MAETTPAERRRRKRAEESFSRARKRVVTRTDAVITYKKREEKEQHDQGIE